MEDGVIVGGGGKVDDETRNKTRSLTLSLSPPESLYRAYVVAKTAPISHSATMKNQRHCPAYDNDLHSFIFFIVQASQVAAVHRKKKSRLLGVSTAVFHPLGPSGHA